MQGGLAVQQTEDRASNTLNSHLAYGSIVKEVALVGGRLCFELVAGHGPKAGWVSLRQQGKEMLKKAHPSALGDPVLVCWYSGGFTPEEGNDLLGPFLAAAKAAGIADQLVLDYPDVYEIKGKGSEPWNRYVDRLVYEINSNRDFRNRPLLLFGHSRGASSAMSVALRLGRRVRKVYIAACAGTSLTLGQPSGWERLSEAFQPPDSDRKLLRWFASLQPDNLILGRMANAPKAEMEEGIESSSWLKAKVELMRAQYRDAIFPDMNDSFDINVISAPILAISPSGDADCSVQACETWSDLTAGACEVLSVKAGHMDCLDPRHLGVAIEDMRSFFRRS